jgi:hypothetical protein
MNALAVVLIISYTMPGRTPDITTLIEEPSLAMCEIELHDFLIRGMPDIVREKGAVKVYAGCSVPKDYTVEE